MAHVCRYDRFRAKQLTDGTFAIYQQARAGGNWGAEYFWVLVQIVTELPLTIELFD
jgi:hypothetical protein